MYRLRFPDEDPAAYRRQELLGREGARVKECYRREAARTGVPLARPGATTATTTPPGTPRTRPSPQQPSACTASATPWSRHWAAAPASACPRRTRTVVRPRHRRPVQDRDRDPLSPSTSPRKATKTSAPVPAALCETASTRHDCSTAAYATSRTCSCPTAARRAPPPKTMSSPPDRRQPTRAERQKPQRREHVVTVIVLTNCPADLRGLLTRWLLEISPGVYPRQPLSPHPRHAVARSPAAHRPRPRPPRTHHEHRARLHLSHPRPQVAANRLRRSHPHPTHHTHAASASGNRDGAAHPSDAASVRSSGYAPNIPYAGFNESHSKPLQRLTNPQVKRVCSPHRAGWSLVREDLVPLLEVLPHPRGWSRDAFCDLGEPCVLPRTRGDGPWKTTRVRPTGRCSPAPAGMVPRHRTRSRPRPGAPRTRGMVPVPATMRRGPRTCSPHPRDGPPWACTTPATSRAPRTRGMVPERPRPRPLARVLPAPAGWSPIIPDSPARLTCSPAPAGMVPSAARTPTPPSSAPRTRGMVPRPDRRHRHRHQCSPHPRDGPQGPPLPSPAPQCSPHPRDGPNWADFAGPGRHVLLHPRDGPRWRCRGDQGAAVLPRTTRDGPERYNALPPHHLVLPRTRGWSQGPPLPSPPPQCSPHPRGWSLLRRQAGVRHGCSPAPAGMVPNGRP